MNMLMTPITAMPGFNPALATQIATRSPLPTLCHPSLRSGSPVSTRFNGVFGTEQRMTTGKELSANQPTNNPFSSLWSPLKAPAFGLSVLMSAGWRGDIPVLDGLSLLAAGLVGALTVLIYNHHRNKRNALAKRYFGAEFTGALNEFITDKSYGDIVYMYRRAAYLASRVINLKPKKRARGIERLLKTWEGLVGCFYDGTPEARMLMGIPAKALLALAGQIPEAFTEDQYKRMANVKNHSGFVPSYSGVLTDAAKLLKPRSEP